MAMNFTELDGTTREWMLQRFDAEESGGNPYPSCPACSSSTFSSTGRPPAYRRPAQRARESGRLDLALVAWLH